MQIKTNESDSANKLSPVGTVVRCPQGATPQPGWTIREVDDSTLTARPADQPTAREKWTGGRVEWVVPLPNRTKKARA